KSRGLSATRVAPAWTRYARPGHRAVLDLLIAIVPSYRRSPDPDKPSIARLGRGVRRGTVPPPQDARARGAPPCNYVHSDAGAGAPRGMGPDDQPRLGAGAGRASPWRDVHHAILPVTMAW